MIEKLKGWLVDGIVFLVAGSVAAAWYFFHLSKRLKDQLFQANAEKELGESVSKQQAAQAKTEETVKVYEGDLAKLNAALDEFNNRPGDGNVH